MSTGTIQNAATQIIADIRHDALQHGYTNSQGAALAKGDEVYMHTDGTVKLRTLGTQIPLGVVMVGAADGERVTVREFFTLVLDVLNGGAGTINAGVLVVPLGTKTNDIPEYDAGAATNKSCAVVIIGAIAGGAMRIGILDSVQIV